MYLNEQPEWNHIKIKGSPERDSKNEWTNQVDTRQVFGLHFHLQKKKKASVFSYIQWTKISF